MRKKGENNIKPPRGKAEGCDAPKGVKRKGCRK
jgi:hypothetical protein